ncbi:MAG: SAM-dependent chlorinase/fluorinase, partial [Candidatus Zixiibacteriota bacterium]
MAVVDTNCPVITITTDFGLVDNYAGIIKGIILYLNPCARIIDISDNVPPFNIEAGSYLLETAYHNFPPGTVHLGVVDPGVGTKRKSLVVETEDHFFVGPDNGLFSFLGQRQIKRIVSLTNKKYFLKDVSPTFHGRDIFAPIAAYLSLGVQPGRFGPEIKSLIRPGRVRTKSKDGMVAGRIIYIDRFGNLVTSLKTDDLPEGKVNVHLDKQNIGLVRTTFGSVRVGRPV